MCVLRGSREAMVFFQLCLFLGSSHDIDCQTPDEEESCMLQVPQAVHLQAHSTSEISQGVNDTSKPEDAWFDRNYHVLGHIKGGWVNSKQSVEGMRLSITAPDGSEPHIYHNASDLAHTLDVNGPEFQKVNQPACFAHTVRNPFEMVVSGYLYDMAGSENWMLASFARTKATTTQIWGKDNVACDPLLIDCGLASKSCQEKFKEHLWVKGLGHQRSMYQLAQCSWKGPLSSLLPDVKESESFNEYLERVDTDAGLIAQTIWASDPALAPMEYLHDHISDLSDDDCSEEMCFGNLYRDCNAEWERVLKAWDPPKAYYDDLLEGAKEGCPLDNEKAEKHSAANKMEEAGLEHPPNNELVQRLRQLDEKHFNGVLAKLERKLSCGLGPKYM